MAMLHRSVEDNQVPHILQQQDDDWRLKSAMSNIRDVLHDDWDAYGATLRSFDDGHVPENLKEANANATQLVDFEIFKRSPGVHVYENAIEDPELMNEIYEKTVNSNPESTGNKAWGDYVTIDQVKDHWQNNSESSFLQVKLSARFLKLALRGDRPDPTRRYSSSGSSEESLFSPKDLENVHGVAIWSLGAQHGTCVPFHLDYAEQIRYEANLIVPPLVAGTLQCTKDRMDGGDFFVSLRGIPHYAESGYKSKKQALDMDDSAICTIPFKYNQMICHLGNLPHGSTKIEKIDGDQLRVIVGFNAFDKKSGPIVRQAPEHSAAFRRKVHVQKLFSRDASFQSIKRNKPLARLLVLAKREKVKREFRQAQDRLEKEIPGLLPSTVQELVDHFFKTSSDSSWPSTPTDLQVYLHHQILKGHYRISSFKEEDTAGTTEGRAKPAKTLVSMEATIEMVLASE